LASRTPSGVHRQPPSPHRTLGFTALLTVHRASFGSPNRACNRHRASSDTRRASSEAHRTLRSPPERLRVFDRPPHHAHSRDLTRASRRRRTPCRAREGFGLPQRALRHSTVRDDSHPSVLGHSPEPSGSTRISPRFDASLHSRRLRRQSRYKDHYARGNPSSNCAPYTGATVVNLTSTPGFGLSQGTS